MSTERILGLLSSEVYLNIAIACLNEPKTPKQIADMLGYKVVNVGQWLQKLEQEGIVEYSGGGWKTKAVVATIVKKYFS